MLFYVKNTFYYSFCCYFLAPHVAEPFLTLATIYEDQGDKERLLQVRLNFIKQLTKQPDRNIN